MRTCKRCRTEFEPTDGRQQYCTKSCRNTNAVTAWRQRTKLKLIRLLGGKCERCGYDRCSAALSFHHKHDKKFALTLSTTRAWHRILREAKKCVLLCANCHMEEHWM